MLGRRFSPRIRAIQKQCIYRIDQDKDYGALTPLVKPRDRITHLNWIVDQWDRMGHFYASLESGHTTASTGLKRLVGYMGKNHFYRANRELGRIFKTEHILGIFTYPLRMVYFKNSSRVQMTQNHKINKPFCFSILD
jgi:TnpA family transposase